MKQDGVRIWLEAEVEASPNRYDDVGVGEYVMFYDPHALPALEMMRRDPGGWTAVNPDLVPRLPLSPEEKDYVRKSYGLDPGAEI